jgi:hypothetical protein
MGHDIIGDIHGCHLSLLALLEELGYRRQDGRYQHASRVAIFLGDFIDRNTGQREVLDIVRPMIDGGSALAVMGNHEFNAIAYATPHPGGGFLREHSDKNRDQHEAFLKAYEESEDYPEIIKWMAGLPLWLDLGELRIVHACWDSTIMARLEAEHGGSRLDPDLLHAASTKGRWEYAAIETLLKGKELPVPEGAGFPDKEGYPRHEIRVQWWNQDAKTYREALMGSASVAMSHFLDEEIPGGHLIEYGDEEPPVFLGHYWMTGTPTVLRTNIACVDFSVSENGGRLVAYRWDGERQLSDDKFQFVERVE